MRQAESTGQRISDSVRLQYVGLIVAGNGTLNQISSWALVLARSIRRIHEDPSIESIVRKLVSEDVSGIMAGMSTGQAENGEMTLCLTVKK